MLLELPEPVEQGSVPSNAGEAGGGLGGSIVVVAAGSRTGGGTGGTQLPAQGGDGGEPPDGCEAVCDCDGDGYLAEGTCGGDDCDDDDDEVHPNQGLYFATRAKHAIVGFDYDCSGELERDPDQGSAIGCSALSLGACEEVQGFHGTQPPCGQPGSWGECEYVTLACKAVVLDGEALGRCH